MRIAVAGGTGTLGHHIVEVARERGHEIVSLTRSSGVDLIAGHGLAARLAGVDAVIDAANITTLSATASTEFFTAVTRNLLAAEREAGVGRHVVVSIVGIDRAPESYYAGKLAQEREVAAGGVPYTIVRATQFHEFAGQMASQTSFAGVVLAPTGTFQPIAARSVAEKLVDVAEGEPVGGTVEIAGPQPESVSDAVRAVVRAGGKRGPVIPVALPMPMLKALRNGAVLPDAGTELRGPTFAEWLAAQ
ncbi:NAD(P)H-binding protein [Agromyces sp. MMS17-SY077]|uniref:NAD(P)H-binding protein n=2 Tax=Agromyces seonyuensis TaxID=2662446 RepID=A0A6I4P0P3_9MICO|nr:NAD(P)H-binding protein [Agromyces seonyuensis]